MNDIIANVVNALDVLYGLPAKAIVLLICIVVCELIRRSTKMSNHEIPWASSLCGVGFSLLLCDPWEVVIPLRIWVGKNIAFGAITGFAAHIIHWKILANKNSKFPVFGGILTGSGNTDPRAFVLGKNANIEPGLIEKMALLDQSKRDNLKPKE